MKWGRESNENLMLRKNNSDSHEMTKKKITYKRGLALKTQRNRKIRNRMIKVTLAKQTICGFR